MRSIRARVTLMAIAIAVGAVVVTGLLSLQLVRGATSDQAREQLAQQVDFLSARPRVLSALGGSATGGALVAIVRGDSVTGDAAPYVDAALLGRLSSDGSVSAMSRVGGESVMIEARATSDGGIVLVQPTAVLDRALARATNRILLALGVGLVLAVAGSAVLSRLLSRPLIATAAAAKRLAAGERGVRMPHSTTTEMADVAAALSALDTALATSEGRQREFLLSISHELRTPLTAVRGYAEAMADGLIPPDRVVAVGETLVAETARLDGFVGDILELARLEADDFSIASSPVSAASVLDEVAAAWSGRAAMLDVTISTQSDDGTLATDPSRLRQIIDGLVENAMRVSPVGSTVLITALRGRIDVLDDGPGLTDDDIAVAFDRGILQSRYRDVRSVGTGLGLSIAARLVERLGGTIVAANRPAGGAVFSVMLPRA